MEKIIRWSCFTASACIVAAFLFALYISTLLPDTFRVGETGEIHVAGMPFLTSYNNNYGLRRGSQPRLFPSQSRSC